MSERHRQRRGVQTVWQVIACIGDRPPREPFRSRHLSPPGRQAVVVHDAVHEHTHPLPRLAGHLPCPTDRPLSPRSTLLSGSEPLATGGGGRQPVAGTPVARGHQPPEWPAIDPDPSPVLRGSTGAAGAGDHLPVSAAPPSQLLSSAQQLVGGRPDPVRIAASLRPTGRHHLRSAAWSA